MYLDLEILRRVETRRKKLEFLKLRDTPTVGSEIILFLLSVRHHDDQNKALEKGELYINYTLNRPSHLRSI